MIFLFFLKSSSRIDFWSSFTTRNFLICCSYLYFKNSPIFLHLKFFFKTLLYFFFTNRNLLFLFFVIVYFISNKDLFLFSFFMLFFFKRNFSIFFRSSIFLCFSSFVNCSFCFSFFLSHLLWHYIICFSSFWCFKWRFLFFLECYFFVHYSFCFSRILLSFFFKNFYSKICKRWFVVVFFCYCPFSSNSHYYPWISFL